MGEQIIARFGPEALDVETGPMGEGLDGADGVDAPDEAADPFQDVRLLKLRRTTAAPGRQ